MRIAIAGYGLEGEQNYHYFAALGHEITIVDEKDVPDKPIPDGAKKLLGEGVFGKLDDFDMIVRTAGLAPRKIKTNGKIWSATNEFFAKCPAPIIGVTGTKGKGTTSSLIASILQAAGRTVHLVGNIGVPALEVLASIKPDDVVVYELSSFQLWDLEKSPHVAVILGIEPDHLDVHQDMAEYVEAKANITRNQVENDVLVFNTNYDIVRQIAETSRANKISYPFDIAKFADALIIAGVHNVENASAAIAAVREYVQDIAIIREGLSNFKGLPHRLKFVREVGGVKFYDDSIATTPGSAIAAINSFRERVTLILGGREKGADLSALMMLCHDRQVSVIAIGENRAYIAELCTKYGVEYSVESGNMVHIVQRAMMEAEKGSVVALSPASASFDMFKSYGDRGDQFIAAVNNL